MYNRPDAKPKHKTMRTAEGWGFNKNDPRKILKGRPIKRWEEDSKEGSKNLL